MNESAAPAALRFYPGNLHIRGIAKITVIIYNR